MKKDGKKKSPVSWIALLFIILPLLSSLFENFSDAFGEIGEIVLIGIVVTVILIVLIIKSAVKAQKKTEGTAKSADYVRTDARERLEVIRQQNAEAEKQGTVTASYYDRYKNQLKGFLKSGIIDRSEYNYLMDKYRRERGN